MPRIRAAPLLLAAALLCLAARPAPAQDEGLQPLMGENYQAVLRMMMNLVQGNFEPIAADAERLRAHARALARQAAERPADGRDDFRGYALALGSQAENLQVVARHLLEQREDPAYRGGFQPEYLQETAAEHFGDLVTTCVGCHTRFRPPQPP